MYDTDTPAANMASYSLPSNDNLIHLPALPKTPRHLNSTLDDLNEYIDADSLALNVASPVRLSRVMHSPKKDARASDRETSRLMLSPTKYPMTSGRQLSNMSTRKKPSPPRPSPLKSHLPSQTMPSADVLGVTLQELDISSMSFRVPSGTMGASMIADCQPPSEGDETMEMDRGYTHPLPQSKTQTFQLSDETQTDMPDMGKGISTVTAALARSTLLPSASSTNAHPLNSSNAIDRVDHPWQTRQTSRKTFPTSSSGGSLDSVGEDSQRQLEVSTILPVSTKITRHLLHDEHMLKTETMTFADDSFMPDQTGTIRGLLTERPAPPSAGTPRHGMDMTLDMAAMMALMKQKRGPTAGEESFADLMHGHADLDALNM